MNKNKVMNPINVNKCQYLVWPLLASISACTCRGMGVTRVLILPSEITSHSSAVVQQLLLAMGQIVPEVAPVCA